MQPIDRFEGPAAERGEAQHQHGVDHEEVGGFPHLLRHPLKASHECFLGVLQGRIHPCFLCRAEWRKTRGGGHSLQEVTTVLICTSQMCVFSEIKRSCYSAVVLHGEGGSVHEERGLDVGFMMMTPPAEQCLLTSAFLML